MESCLRGSKRNTNTNKTNNTQNRTIKQQHLTRKDYYLEQQQQQQQQQQQNTKQQYEEQELEDFQLYQLQRRKQKAFLQRQQQQQQQNVNSNENCAQVFATTTLTTKPKFVNNCLQFSAPPPPNYPPPILNATTTITTTTSIDTPTTIDTTKTTKMANRQQQQQSGLHSQHHLHMQQQQLQQQQQTPNNLNLQLQHHVQSTINTLQQQINNLHIEMDTNNRDTRIMNMSHQHQHSHQQQQHPHSHQHQHGIHQQLPHGNGNGNGLMGHGHGHGHHGISALNSSRSPTSTLTSSSSSTSVSMNSGNNMGISPCSRRGHGAMPRYPDPDPDAIEICNEPREINLTRRRDRDRDRDRERGRDRDREHRERERERQLALEAESMHWPATPHTSSHDYSYAYYEPGVAMRHSNIPAASISPSLSPLGQTPQPPPPPNSMRALLSKGKKNKSLVSAATRHCYQTRYGMRNGECAMQLHPLNTLPHNMLLMHENFYEEISSATEAHAPLRSGVNGTNSHSAGSLNQSLVEEELRRVQSRHRKILGELNLSVEAMLMPESPPPTVGLGCEDDVGANKEKPTVSVTASSGQPNMVSGVRLSASSADNICASSQLSEEMQNNSQLGFCAADLDSGFSGSSGASYIGSLRIHKTNAALSQIKQEKRQVQTTSSGTGTGVSNSLCPFPYATQSCRSFQRGNVTTTRLSQEDDADNDAGFLTRASCGRRILNCAKLRAAEDPGPVGSAAAMAGNTPPTMSKARSFWNRKGWRKLPGFSTSTSSINDTGLTDETKLNSSSWDDPSSTSLSNNNNNISLGNGLSNGSNTTTTAQLHNSATLRCNDSLKLPIRQTYKGLLLPAAADCEASTTSNGSKIAGGSINSNGGGGSGGGGVDTSTTVRPPLEHSISWCSSQAPEAEEEEELSDAGGTTSATHHLINRSNTSLGGVTNTSDEEATVTEDESNLTTSLSANNQRNSQLRSTFNRAKQHLDKWRSSTSSSSSNSNSISSTTQTTQNPQTNGIETLTSLQQQTPIQQQQAQQQQQLNQQSRRASTSATMPTAHQSAREEITTPGETPTGRLSRWFSIRRGSSHQYDIGGRDGRHSAATSLDIPDASTHNCGDSTSFGNNQKLLNNSAGSGNSYKMPGLPENDDDENINLNGNTACAASRFDLDLMIPPGSRANGTARNAHTRLITPMLPPAPPGLSQQQLKRRHIVAAIVHSENSYVATLQRLVNDYKKPLEESNPPVLSANKIGTLFHRLPEILQSHKLFRISLSECVLNWDRDEKLGDCFVSAFSKPSVLEIYSGFINNFSAAMELAKMEEKRKSALADFFKVKQISAHDRLSFFGLMVKPVQRFPQFILFLQDLLKYTPQGHHDRMSLQLALTQLELLAELLNERKREAEQHQGFKEMLGHISGTFNARSLLTSADGARPRYLLREDNVTHLEFNQAGFVIKSKQRRLLLLNDKVICVSVAPKQSHDFGATEKLTFKWMYPVTDVEIVDNSTSATLSRILTAGLNRGGSLKSTGSTCNSGTHNSNTLPLNSTYPNNLAGTVTDQLNSGSQKSNGADNLCNEMSTLMYDYEVISRIHDLVGSLKSTYKELNTNITRNLLNSIQGSIQRKDEEMAWVDSCCLQLIARNKSGKEETFTFQTQSPNVKKEWMTELRLAQLALDTNNSPAWETAAVPEPTRHNFEQIQTQHKQTNKLPLFVKAIPVYKSQHQTEVRCGCYYTIANDQRLSGNSRRRAKQQNYLWICTSDGHTSHMAIYTQNQQQAGGNLRDVGSFDLEETQVCAMEFVKGLDNCKTREEYNSLLGDLIWFGTDAKKILIYSAQNPEQEQQLAQCTVPGTVTRILYHFDAVYVALSNAMILIYRRSYEGLWLLKEPQQVQLGESGLSVPSILPINMNIYACCANRVYVLNALNGEIQKSFEVHHGANQQVNLMAHSGIGLWISLKNSTMLCLYHTETFKHLQDINIASSVLRHDSKKEQSVNNSSIYVTALMACKGLLWVGTNVGIAVTIPLPRLEGVPIISGGINMSCHAHFGPITFLLPLIPKVYPSYKPPSNLLTQLSVEAAATPTPAPAPPSMGDDLQLPAIDADPQKLTEEDLDESTVILRRDIVHLDSNTSSPRSSKLEKQSSLDQSFSAKIRASLAQSPAFHRKRFRDLSLESSRTSKTLPRALGSTHSNTSTLTHNEHGYCDVYGLYGKLIFVKENYDADESAQGNLMDMLYADMRRSDPELAAIPGKVSTLDRRLRMKASRPRSLDLSNWSVDSKSSSLYTSSGSEESMGIRLFGGRSVSRNSSSASHKTSGNGSDLGNISENGLMTTTTLESYVQSTPKSAAENAAKKCVTPPPAAAQATLKRKQKQNAKQQQQQNADGPRTIITLMGGRGYWRHVWYNNQSPGVKTGTLNPSTSGGNSPLIANSNDAHIVMWEKKL